MSSLSQSLLGAAVLLLEGRPRGDARRRAASTAYYALFHRLSGLCATALMGAPEATAIYERAYRALDHRASRRALTGSEEFKARLGAAFAELQDIRNWADYSPSAHPDEAQAKSGERFTLAEARDCVESAREAMGFIDQLDKPARRRLARLLLVRDNRH